MVDNMLQAMIVIVDISEDRMKVLERKREKKEERETQNKREKPKRSKDE